MAAKRPVSYTALHDPDDDPSVSVIPVEMATDLARRELAVRQTANIHEADAMLTAAVALEYQLRQLLAALDAQKGGR